MLALMTALISLIPQDAPQVTTPFVANQGQWPESARFQYRTGPATAWVHDDGLTLVLVDHEAPAPRSGEGWGMLPHVEPTQGVALRFRFVAGATDRVRGRVPLPTVHSSFVGRDPRHWSHGAPSFARVEQPSLGAGVALHWLQREGRLTFDLDLAPGASLADTTLAIDGADRLAVAADGSLRIETAIGALRLTAPQSWEVTDSTTRPVASRFRLTDASTVAFEVDRVDRSAALVIDPGLDWSTFVGGADLDDPLASRLDDAGRLYTVGYVENQPFPTTLGAFQPTYGGGVRDLWVHCADPDQTGAAQFVWSTHVGGIEEDVAYDLEVSPSGDRVTVVGITSSPDFPVTPNALQNTKGAVHDGLVVQLTSGGTQLAYGSYFGGNGVDRIGSIRTAANGSFVTVGYGSSTDLPVPAGAFQPTSAGGFDAFVAVLDLTQAPAGQVTAATYLGGSADEGVWGGGSLPVEWDLMDVGVQTNGSITIVGSTASADFPTTAGAYQSEFGGGQGRDLFVARFDSTLANATYATYIGRSNDETPFRAQLNDVGDVYITALVWSPNFPTTPGAYQTTFGGGGDGALIVLRPDGNGPDDLRYSTLIGGPGADPLGSVVIESTGVVTCAGTTRGGLTPTAQAMQSTFSGTATGYLFRLDPAGNGATDMHYLSYLGAGAVKSGLLWEGVLELVAHPDGRYLAAPWTDNPSFPITVGAAQSTFGGAPMDTVLVRLDLLPESMTRLRPSTPACAGPIDMQISTAPVGGAATLELLCNDVPPDAAGVLLVGTPLASPVPVAGVQLTVLPVVAPPVVASGNSARTPLPIPAGFPAVHPPIAVQYVWLTSPSCPGTGPLAASDGLQF